MSKHDEPAGGYAFPWTIDYADGSSKMSLGMSLRDYLASAALNRLLAWDSTADMTNFPHYAQEAAKTAYGIADAMIAERLK